MAGSVSGNKTAANNIAGAVLLGGLFGNKDEKASRGGQERSAQDWHNENIMKEADFTRETRRRQDTLTDLTNYTPKGRTARSVSADGRGGFAMGWENQRLPQVVKDVVDSNPAASEKPAGKSTIKRGQQTGGKKETITGSAGGGRRNTASATPSAKPAKASGSVGSTPRASRPAPKTTGSVNKSVGAGSKNPEASGGSLSQLKFGGPVGR